MAISKERRAFLKDRTRYWAAGLVESTEAIASGQFDDLGLTHEEQLLIEAEMQAIGKRIWKARSPAPSPHVVGTCPECHGTGEVFGHADDCSDDLCALNGDMHSCSGKVEPCSCTAPPAAEHVVVGEITDFKLSRACSAYVTAQEYGVSNRDAMRFVLETLGNQEDHLVDLWHERSAK